MRLLVIISLFLFLEIKQQTRKTDINSRMERDEAAIHQKTDYPQSMKTEILSGERYSTAIARIIFLWNDGDQMIVLIMDRTPGALEDHSWVTVSAIFIHKINPTEF